MKLIFVIFLFTLLSGCSTPRKMEVIQPQTSTEKQPKLRWVTRGNITYLEIIKED